MAVKNKAKTHNAALRLASCIKGKCSSEIAILMDTENQALNLSIREFLNIFLYT
jgi:hypothetical protein